MDRKELVREYAQKNHTRVYRAEEIISNLEDLIIELIKSGETINLRGFCEIGTKKTKDRKGTSPVNSEPIIIKGGRKIYFRPLARLKSAAGSMTS